MAVITITEAAKTWGCGRATIYRKLESGGLSASPLPDGGRGVDTSEMLRVFGPAVSSDVSADTVRQSENAAKQAVDADLRRENDHLRELLQAKDEHIETLKQALRLIEDKRQPAEPADDAASAIAAVMERSRAEAEDLQEELKKAKAEAERLAALETELTRSQQEAAELAQRLEAERGRGFWSRLFGGRS